MFKPINRHLLIEKVEEKKEESKSTILVPDDYKVKSSPYGLYTVKDIARDCEKSFGGNGTKIAGIWETIISLIVPAPDLAITISLDTNIL